MSPGAVPLRFRSLRWRRAIALSVTALAALAMYRLHREFVDNLGNAPLFSGSVLLACLFVLVGLGIRRRLVMLPLGSVSSWMQVHLYTGLFACWVYLLHVPAIVASGQFEALLSGLFLTVSASGWWGLYAARSIPKRLSAVSIDPRYDQIDWHRHRLGQQMRRQLDGLRPGDGGEVLVGFAQAKLLPYVDSGLPLSFRIRPTPRRQRLLLTELNDLRRYCGGEVLSTVDRLASLIRRRDELDYQHALQWQLRSWVVVHAVLSLLLLLAAVLHAAVALNLQGR